jgi:beta-glucanase (GH16 family)
MLGVLSVMGSAIATVVISAPFAARVAAVAADGACPVASVSQSCKNVGRSASDHVLLQRSSGAQGLDSLVHDWNGSGGGDLVSTDCSGAEVRRRRQVDAMCSCRRRDSGKRYDGGWVCQDDAMVQEPPQYTNPVWSEEFDDERGDGSLNESRWELIHSGSGNANDEKQFYLTRRENLNVDNGMLNIVGKFDGFESKNYTSGQVVSRNKNMGPGTRIEVRAKLPLGVGTWPAIRMMPTDSNYGRWPDSGEIDIMEAIGREHGKVNGTIHTGAYNRMLGAQQGKSFYTDFGEWHTYALNWELNQLTWYVDGNLYSTFAPDNVNDYAQWPYNRRFYLIINLALGGSLAGEINILDDQVMHIDYVRVFCLDGSMNCNTEKITCCSDCPGQRYCSPKSRTCHAEKKNDYYDTCED